MADVDEDRSVGRYQLETCIARGGMGEIYVARDLVLGRRVVIKRLLPALAVDRGMVDTFLHEGRAIAQVRHPNVIQVHDVGYDREHYYLVLEWLTGWNLRHIAAACRDDRVPPRIVLTLARDAALGLHAAHTARGPNNEPLNIIHRDVSPHNLLVTVDGELKVLDFGIAKSKRSRRDTTGIVRGKPSYMSPEQIRIEPLDGRSDLFSLGVVCYELLTGERLFSRPTPKQVCQAVLFDPIPPPADVAIPEAALRVLNVALERDRDMRFESGEVMAREVESAAASIGGVASPDEICLFLRELFPESGPGSDEVGSAEILGDALTRLTRSTRDTTTEPDLPTIEVSSAFAPAGTMRLPPPGRSRRGRWLLAAPLAAAVLLVAAWLLWPSAALDDPAGDRTPAADAATTVDAPPAVEPTGAPIVPTDAAETSVDTPAGTNDAVKAKRRGSKRAKRRRANRTPPNKSAGFGTVSIQSIPWAKVYINGELIGPTPIIRHRVRAGTLDVRLENPELGLSAREEIAVAADADVKRRFALK